VRLFQNPKDIGVLNETNSPIEHQIFPQKGTDSPLLSGFRGRGGGSARQPRRQTLSLTKETAEELPKEYTKAAKVVAEKQAALAGYRLAGEIQKWVR
jgi:hypothetical protein